MELTIEYDYGRNQSTDNSRRGPIFQRRKNIVYRCISFTCYFHRRFRSPFSNVETILSRLAAATSNVSFDKTSVTVSLQIEVARSLQSLFQYARVALFVPSFESLPSPLHYSDENFY